MAISFVQDGDTGASFISSGAAGTVFSGNATVGHTVIVCIQAASTTSGVVSGVTSSFGTPSKIIAFAIPSGSFDLEFWSIPVTSAAATITVTTTGAVGWTAQATEWSSLTPITVSSGGSQQATSITAGITATTSAGNVMLAAVNNGGAGAYSAGPSSPAVFYNLNRFALSTTDGTDDGWVIATGSSTTLSWTQSSAQFAAIACILSSTILVSPIVIPKIVGQSRNRANNF